MRLITDTECASQCADYQRPNDTSVTEAHFRLRRMNIDVNLFGWNGQRQRDDGMTARSDDIAIGNTHGSSKNGIGNRPTVDDQHLRDWRRPGHRWCADKTGDPVGPALLFHRQQNVRGIRTDQRGDAFG